MIVRDEVLSEAQQTILPNLGEFAASHGFYLGGDTAVALHLGHRRSIDFDWFTQDRLGDPLLLAEEVRRAGLAVANAQVAHGTLHAVIGGVRVSFLEYLYAPISKPVAWIDTPILLASLDDLGCMKLAAIAQRGSRKDFIDLHFIAREHKPIEELVELYRKKYSTGDIAHVLIGLTYFEDAENEQPPIMLRGAAWEEVKEQFRVWTKNLAG